MDDADILADAPAYPMQDSEEDANTNDVLPSACWSSCRRQCKITRSMAESMSYGNRNMFYMVVQKKIMHRQKPTSFMILTMNFENA